MEMLSTDFGLIYNIIVGEDTRRGRSGLIIVHGSLTKNSMVLSSNMCMFPPFYHLLLPHRGCIISFPLQNKINILYYMLHIEVVGAILLFFSLRHNHVINTQK